MFSLNEDRYIAALTREFNEIHEQVKNRPVSSIFLGGGTPSLFRGKSLDKLLTHIRQSAECVNSVEITMEANPGTLEYIQVCP